MSDKLWFVGGFLCAAVVVSTVMYVWHSRSVEGMNAQYKDAAYALSLCESKKQQNITCQEAGSETMGYSPDDRMQRALDIYNSGVNSVT